MISIPVFICSEKPATRIMFTYLTSFLDTILHRSASDIGFIMLVLGIAGAIGSRIGGSAVVKWGSVRIMFISMIVHVVTLALLPLAIHSFPLAIALLSLWVMSMFIMGLAAGAGVGGMAVTFNATVLYNPWVASVVLLLAFIAVIVSFQKSRRTQVVTA